jgi:hypothetical protein
MIHDIMKARAIGEQWRDILEDDARFGKVHDVPKVALAVLEGQGRGCAHFKLNLDLVVGDIGSAGYGQDRRIDGQYVGHVQKRLQSGSDFRGDGGVALADLEVTVDGIDGCPAC